MQHIVALDGVVVLSIPVGVKSDLFVNAVDSIVGAVDAAIVTVVAGASGCQ